MIARAWSLFNAETTLIERAPPPPAAHDLDDPDPGNSPRFLRRAVNWRAHGRLIVNNTGGTPMGLSDPTPVLITGALAAETWRRLIDCANDRAHPMHLMAMATAGIDGRPAARVMTIRGASRELGTLWL